MTTASRPSWPPRPDGGCSRCGRAAATRTPCGTRVTGAPTSSSPPSWPGAVPATRCCPGWAGAKAAAVICGDAEGYGQSGGQYEWDWAAPVAGALAAGLHASRIDGSRLSYNQDPPSVPDILICQAALADMLLGVISSVRQD